MKPHRFSGLFATLFDAAVGVAGRESAHAVLISLDGPTNWEELKTRSGDAKLIVAADRREKLEGAQQAGLHEVLLDMEESPIYENLSQALLEAEADDILEPGARVIAL